VKTLRVHEAARREGVQATLWYAERNPSIALRFREELLAAYRRLLVSPMRYPAYLQGTRRILLPTFPYFVVFLEVLDHVYVVAVAHAKQRSGYWKKRL
jgi:plasmid stabilization system protein ParE